jgi:hypothetical protein
MVLPPPDFALKPLIRIFAIQINPYLKTFPPACCFISAKQYQCAAMVATKQAILS